MSVETGQQGQAEGQPTRGRSPCIDGDIALIINTPLGHISQWDETAIRKTALPLGVPLITTLSGAAAAVEGIRALREEQLGVVSLQELHETQ